jgi:predicted permease
MRRVFRIPFSARVEREVDDELVFHLEMRTQRLVASGMTPDAARREALRQFGDVTRVRRDCVTMDEQRERATRRAFKMAEFQQDLVYALRTLRRNVGFTAIVVFALALGIGANTAIFTLINAVMVRSIPVADPESLVAIGNPVRVSSLSQGGPRTDLLSYPLYKDVRDRNHVFSGMLATGRTGRLDVRIDDGAGTSALEHPRGRFVSGNYFSVLGIKPVVGRAFTDADDRVPGDAPIAAISHGYWTRRFHNDRSVIGRQVVVSGSKFTIVGVMPRNFTGEIVGAETDVWLPLSMQHVVQPNQRMLDDRLSSFLLALGRLKPGVTTEQARQEVTTLMRESIVANAVGSSAKDFLASSPQYFVSDGSRGFSRVRNTFQAPLFTLMIGVALLLGIICANVANLLLARSLARGREMAVRLALGANRARLVRQLLTEGLILAALGAATGLLVAWWGSRGLVVLGGGSAALDLGMDAWVLAFTLAVCCASVLLFGLVPALRASRVDLATTMRANAYSVSGGALGHRGQRAPLGRLLIAAQVALSVVLLVGAGMLVRSLRHVENIDVGMDRDHLVILDVDAQARGYVGPRMGSLVHSLRDRLSAIPGVAAVAYSMNGIFSGSESQTTVQVAGFSPRTPNDSVISLDEVAPGYIGAIGGRMIEGRDIAASDEGNLARVAVVNDALAKFYFPSQSAVGRFISISDSVAIQIIGVAADTRDRQLNGAPARRAYFPFVHRDTMIGLPATVHFEIRTRGEPTAVVQAIRAAVVAVDQSLPIEGVDPVRTLMRQSIAAERLVARLATGFGALALLLAAIGLYGVMTYAITRRTGEIGLRVALGAARGDVIGLVLADALRVVAVGVVVGLPLAIATARLLKSQLHGVEMVDPLSIAGAIVVLSASAVVAVLLPALRASRVSPIVALRAE